ncbi:hypothetical protein PR048_031878 [Dryococelus australis]|uniref:Uncharacterized protein n=1 Tax=Dryococelus australis TaxID=614101 RepID=A0ABQ9G6I5_9NEOP|nr:hypothetical protein PR048_031878 [Dryococelus australis]
MQKFKKEGKKKKKTSLKYVPGLVNLVFTRVSRMELSQSVFAWSGMYLRHHLSPQLALLHGFSNLNQTSTSKPAESTEEYPFPTVQVEVVTSKLSTSQALLEELSPLPNSSNVNFTLERDGEPRERHRNEGEGKRETPEKTRRPMASSGTIPTCDDPEWPGRGLSLVLIVHSWLRAILAATVAERLAYSPPTKAIRVQSSALSLRFSHEGIVPEDAFGRWVFLGDLPFPHPFIPALLHIHLNHPHRLSRPRRPNLFTHSFTRNFTEALPDTGATSSEVTQRSRVTYSGEGVSERVKIFRRFLKTRSCLDADESEARGVWSSAGIQEWRKQDIPEKTRRPAASYGMIPTCDDPVATQPGIGPGSPRREASSLTTAAPLLMFSLYREQPLVCRLAVPAAEAVSMCDEVDKSLSSASQTASCSHRRKWRMTLEPASLRAAFPRALPRRLESPAAARHHRRSLRPVPELAHFIDKMITKLPFSPNTFIYSPEKNVGLEEANRTMLTLERVACCCLRVRFIASRSLALHLRLAKDIESVEWTISKRSAGISSQKSPVPA